MPIGAQLVAPAEGEARLLSLAAQLEAGRRWDEQYPPHSH
jgi:amidase